MPTHKSNKCKWFDLYPPNCINFDPDDWVSIFDFRPKIEKVIFNPPATIVLWSDGTKTVVKCQEGDEWDAEKGLAMAISKKWFCNKGRFNDEFEKWISPQQ